MNRLLISGIDSWISLPNKVISHNIVNICHMKKSNLWHLGPYKILSDVVVVKNCDRDFIKYNITPIMFPDVKIIYLDSYIEKEQFNEWKIFSTKNNKFRGIFYEFNSFENK